MSKKLKQTEELPPEKIDAAPVKPVVNISWKWIPYEKQFWILIVVALWGLMTIYFAFFLNEVKQKTHIKGLKPTIFGFLHDAYDFQWNQFISNFPLLLITFLSVIGVGKIGKALGGESVRATGLTISSFLALSYLSRGGIVILFFLILSNYVLVKSLAGTKIFPYLVWTLGIATLYFNDRYHGYDLSKISDVFTTLEETRKYAFLQWHVFYPMTLLKIISFSMDFHWKITGKHVPTIEEHQRKCIVCAEGKLCLRIRTEKNARDDYYSLLYYLTYVTYFPLFMTGPIISFNAFTSQLRLPQNTHSFKEILKYAIRILFGFVTFQAFLVFFPVNAIATNPENESIWRGFNVFQILLLGFYELIFLWFKFLNVWRITRLFAFLDGFETPENMNRCICNNYCFEGFWRSWHRSFNQWLIRYIFIPLGGAKLKQYNVWVVFTFVAIWHEFNLNLIFWAWGICLSLMPEISLKWFFSRPKYLWRSFWWKYLCAVAGAFDIFLMVSANLVGFSIGWKGFLHFSNQCLSFSGLAAFLSSLSVYFASAIVMFAIREDEDEKLKGF